MANLKTKKTAAGAQQYSSNGAAKKLNKSLDKDVQAYIDGKMTAAEFKEKYGVSVAKAQRMVYGASAAERGSHEFEREMARESKEMGMSKGGMAKKKMGYASGGLACGASNQAARPIKKGK